MLNQRPQLLWASLGLYIRAGSADVSLLCPDIKSTGWGTPERTHGALPSPLAFLSLRKMQCSSLMCAPLKTMSCRLSASAWPTLRQSQKPFWGLEHCHCVSRHFVKMRQKNKWTLWTSATFKRKELLKPDSFSAPWHLMFSPGAGRELKPRRERLSSEEKLRVRWQVSGSKSYSIKARTRHILAPVPRH